MMGKTALRRTRWRRRPYCEGHDGHPRRGFTPSVQRERRDCLGGAGLRFSANACLCEHGW